MRMAYSTLCLGVFAVVAYGLLQVSKRRKKLEDEMQPMLVPDQEDQRIVSDTQRVSESLIQATLQSKADFAETAPRPTSIENLEETRPAFARVESSIDTWPLEAASDPKDSNANDEEEPSAHESNNNTELSEDPPTLSSGERKKVRFASDMPEEYFKTAERGPWSRKVEGSESATGSKRQGTPASEGSVCTLEVVSGPCKGATAAWPALRAGSKAYRIGRIPENDLVVNDPEVSGRHATVTWHRQSGRWELVDEGSLNGTFLNRAPVGTSGTGVRKRSGPVPLSDSDVITLGPSSRAEVSIAEPASTSGRTLLDEGPFSLGVASDPMSARRGQALPMEDVVFCHWPLPGLENVGIFCIFDGHCGRGAADAASQLLPSHLSRLLSDTSVRQAVSRDSDAAGVLREAFAATEAELTMEDEGCTATVLLAWMDEGAPSRFFVQCANVGDSHCFLNLRDKVLQLTEDHRVVNPMERNRLSDAGFKLGHGETRLCGMNIARALGDKFLKGQNVGLSAKPHVSRAYELTADSSACLVMASDGLWDVMSGKRALQLAAEVQVTNGGAGNASNSPSTTQQIADTLVMRAKMAKAHDNVTALVIELVDRR